MGREVIDMELKEFGETDWIGRDGDGDVMA